jgi:hypothetical protein
MSTNYATTLGDRPYHTDVAAGDPPPEFAETPPVHPVSPSAPAYPGTLNSAERAEVDRYLNTPTDAVLCSLRLKRAIDKANEFKTYYADPAIQAYLFARKLARKAQWRLAHADAIVNNLAAIPPLGDPTGIGGGTPPDPAVPPGHNVP